MIRDYTTFDNETTSVKWLNFHLNHKDRVRITLETMNGALNKIHNSTDGFIVDLTPPKLIYLGDGNNSNKDINFQVRNSLFIYFVVVV